MNIGDRGEELDLEIFGGGPLTRFRRWFLIRGSRRAVIGLLFAVVYVAFVAMTFIWQDFTQLLRPANNNVGTLFNTLLSGVILLVSIVTSINSLSVSQELTTVGNQHERVTDSWNFREEAADIVQTDVSPPIPGEFLKEIIEQVETDLDEFRSLADEGFEGGDGEAEEIRDEMHDYLDEIKDGLERTENVVSDPKRAAVNVAMFGSSYDVSEHVDAVRRLQIEYTSAIESDEIDERLDRIVDSLQYFISAREYFKTVYYKREFSYLSRDLIYTGLPAILLVSYVLVGLPGGADNLPGAPRQFIFQWGFGELVNTIVLFMAFAYTVALLPFLVLTAYALRSAVIAQKTISEGAFSVE